MQRLYKNIKSVIVIVQTTVKREPSFLHLIIKNIMFLKIL